MTGDLRWQFFANLGGKGKAWGLMRKAPSPAGWILILSMIDRVYD